MNLEDEMKVKLTPVSQFNILWKHYFHFHKLTFKLHIITVLHSLNIFMYLAAEVAWGERNCWKGWNDNLITKSNIWKSDMQCIMLCIATTCFSRCLAIWLFHRLHFLASEQITNEFEFQIFCHLNRWIAIMVSYLWWRYARTEKMGL